MVLFENKRAQAWHYDDEGDRVYMSLSELEECLKNLTNVIENVKEWHSLTNDVPVPNGG